MGVLDEMSLSLGLDPLILGYLRDPDFGNARKCHDWRNHVPVGIMTIWGRLSLETRAVVYFMALERADREEWD